MDIRHAAPLVNRTRFLGMSPERGDRNPHAKFLSVFNRLSSARPVATSNSTASLMLACLWLDFASPSQIGFCASFMIAIICCVAE